MATTTSPEADSVSLDLKGLQPTSIYEIRSHKARNAILLVSAFVSILLPFSDTVYLPALRTMQEDLNTTATLTAASVAIYMLGVGLAALFWGPFADYYGRRLTYWVSMAGFLATTLVCIFAPSIGVLIAFRALQGCFIASTVTIGNAVVADIFPPETRGTASGVFLIPLLIGPILGPVVGGGLSQAFGWRSTFVSLAILGVAMLLLLLLGFKETHPHYVLAQLRKSDPAAADKITEAASITQPAFQAPWRPLRYFFEHAVAIHATATFVTFAVMFASLIELPLVVAKAPYYMSEAATGAAYLAEGLGGFLASPIGGKLADMAGRRYGSRCPEGRLLYNTIANTIIMPSALLLFGWSFHYRTHLAVPLVAHFFIGVACSQYLPAIFSYLSVAKQQEAGAAGAMVQSLMFVGAAVVIAVSGIIVSAIGVGPFFSILAGLMLAVSAAALLRVVLQLRLTHKVPAQAQREDMQVDVDEPAAQDKQ